MDKLGQKGRHMQKPPLVHVGEGVASDDRLVPQRDKT